MFYYLAENPWYLAGAAAIVAVGFLIALRMTQDGKYLVRALIALGVAIVVLIVEQLWVTDNERLEWVVKDMVNALSHSDADRMIDLMDEHVAFSLRATMQAEELDLNVFRNELKNATFDWVYMSRLTTNAGTQSGRGSAEFKLSTAGTYLINYHPYTFSATTQWSFGFRKVPGKGWKVNRITAVVLPNITLPMVRSKTRTGQTSGGDSSSSMNPTSPFDAADKKSGRGGGRR